MAENTAGDKGNAKGGKAPVKKPGKKKQKTRKAEYYQIDGKAIKRAKKCCPKCGSGIFMAEHKDRYSCGKCSYTEWMQGAGR